MTFYGAFPKTEYDGRIIVDISRRANIPDDVKNRAGTYDEYDVLDGEKIEDVAYKIYGDPEYHWVIMLMNNIIDPFFDWVMNTEELISYVALNYADPTGVHHWELDGRTVPAGTAGAVSISNSQHEDILNENKRRIKLLRPSYISRIRDELTKVL